MKYLALEGKGASQHVRPSLVQGPPVSQKAPGEVAETLGTVQSVQRAKTKQFRCNKKVTTPFP